MLSRLDLLGRVVWLFIQWVRTDLLIPQYGSDKHLDPAAGVTLLACLLSMSFNPTMTLLACLMSFLAALITLIAFAIDVALLVWVKHQMGELSGVTSDTNPTPGQWSTSSFYHVNDPER